MAFNFGVSKPAVAAGSVPSVEELFDAYMGVESVVRATDIFLQKGQKIEEAFENLCIVGSALKKHASAEGLAVVKDIVRDELGVEVSVEAFKDKAKAALSAIGEFFKKIGIWIQEFFAKIFHAVVNADKRLDKAIEFAEKLPAGQKLTWKYYGPSMWKGAVQAMGNIDLNVSMNVSSRTGDVKGDLSKAKKQNAELANSRYAETTVENKEQTLNVLKNAKYYIAYIKKFQDAITKEYKSAKEAVAKASKDDDIKALKDTQKRMKAAVAMTKRECASYARSIMSVVIHAPTKPTKASKENN